MEKLPSSVQNSFDCSFTSYQVKTTAFSPKFALKGDAGCIELLLIQIYSAVASPIFSRRILMKERQASQLHSMKKTAFLGYYRLIMYLMVYVELWV